MAIQLIHVSDIHFGSGERHGPLNPQTGLNVRFEDFVAALSKVVDYAIETQADIFLFSGDAYKTANPEPIYQKMFAMALKRLSDAGIQTILLVGNHDQILKSTASHSLSVFQSLEVPGVVIIDKPVCFKLDTKGGALQIIGIPHVTRHQLMTLEKYAQAPAAVIDRILVENVDAILKGYYQTLDANIPTVVTAHMTVDRALAGIEQELLVGYTQTFPSDIFVDARVDYVALGHVHKYQVIRPESPPIVYAGSLERVDFGEQKEDKGFMAVQIERGHTKFEFVSINPRPFVTVEADLSTAEDPTEKLSALVRKHVQEGCVLRVRYKIRQDQVNALDDELVRLAGSAALSVRLQPEIVAEQSRARLPQLNETSVTSPLKALDTYLEEVAPQRKERLLGYAQQLMSELES